MEKNRIPFDFKEMEKIPVFADDVLVSSSIKYDKNEKGPIAKDGYISIFPIDRSANRPIMRLVLTRMTAKSLMKILEQQLKKLESEIKSDKEPGSDYKGKEIVSKQEYIG